MLGASCPACECGHPPGGLCEAGAQRIPVASPAGALVLPSQAVPTLGVAEVPPSLPAAPAGGRSARHSPGADGVADAKSGDVR